MKNFSLASFMMGLIISGVISFILLFTLLILSKQGCRWTEAPLGNSDVPEWEWYEVIPDEHNPMWCPTSR